MVVFALLSAAILSVRGAMQARRGRAELAWQTAHACIVADVGNANAVRAEQRRRCIDPLHRAAELALELPERGSRQLEFDAALGELTAALSSGDEPRVMTALDRSSRAANALGWRSATSVR